MRLGQHEKSGAVGDIRTNVRLVLPSTGCLRCNKLISGARLQEESLGENERQRNRYVNEVPAPGVDAPAAMGRSCHSHSADGRETGGDRTASRGASSASGSRRFRVSSRSRNSRSSTRQPVLRMVQTWVLLAF